MKRALWITVLLLSFLTFFACSSDDDIYNGNISYIARGIDSVRIPETITLGERVNIELYTTKLENCQEFQTIGNDPTGFENTVVTWFIQRNTVACGEEELATIDFFFEPVQPATYHFRFWAGQDEETQEDIFITKDIVVE